jgi:hypothetical protein
MALLPRRIALALALACACTGRARGGVIADSLADSLSATVHAGAALALRSYDRRREDGAASQRRPEAGVSRISIRVAKPIAREVTARLTVALERAPLLGEAFADSVVPPDGVLRMEEAALEWREDRPLGFEAGLLLVPVGWLNESHEAANVVGAIRNDVETRVIPVVWSALGAGLRWSGVHGLSGRACVVQGLDASRFSATTGLRDGRPADPRSPIAHAAAAVRLDWQDAHGVGVGGSLYTGDAWQGPSPAGEALHARVTLREAHGSLRAGRAFARALYMMGSIGDHEALTRALGLAGTSDAIGSRFFGGYVEAGLDVAPGAPRGARRSLSPFARFELSDTQDGVGAIGTEDPSRHRTTLTVGLRFAPATGFVLTAERQERHDELRTQAGEWNAAMAYSF